MLSKKATLSSNAMFHLSSSLLVNCHSTSVILGAVPHKRTVR